MALVFTGLVFFAGIVTLFFLLCVAVAAKIRKRGAPKRRYIALAAGVTMGSLIAALLLPSPPTATGATADARNAAASGGLPAYLVLRRGQHAYLDSNAEGDGTVGTLFADWATVQKWYSGNFVAPSDLRHIDLPAGTEVVVDSWRTIGTGEDAKRMILVHTTSAPVRSGYSYDVLLLPLPPAGSPVILSGIGQPTRGKRDKGVPLFPTRNAAVKDYVDVRTLTKAVVLDVDNHRDTDWPYHVRITDGRHKGRSGYLARYAVSVPSDGAGGGEYSSWCKCVTMYLNTGSDK